MFCWPCISIHPCNKNQLDALFILSLFRQLTATCFGHIYRPLSGGIMYTYSNWYVLCFSVDWLLANRESTEKHKTYQLLAQHIPNVSYVLCFSVDCWPTESQLKSTKRTNFWHNTYQMFYMWCAFQLTVYWPTESQLKSTKRTNFWHNTYQMFYMCCAFQLTVCWPTDSRPKSTKRTNCGHNPYQLLYIYSIPPDDRLQILPKHVEVDWRNKLRIYSASSWFLSHIQ